MSIISSNGEILQSFNLGFEDGNQFVFSNSTKLLSGVYISSHERSCNCNSNCEACNHHEIRIRPDYDDKLHFEVLYRDKCWLSNRFGVNSSGHVYILEGTQVKIYLHANSMTYQGRTRKYGLDTIYTSKEELTHITIDDNDTIFLVEGGRLKMYTSDFTQQYPSPLPNEIKEYYSILSTSNRLEYNFCIYDIEY